MLDIDVSMTSGEPLVGLFRRGTPVLQQRDGRGRDIVRDSVDEKATVAGDVILWTLATVHSAGKDTRLEQWHGRTSVKRRTVNLDRCGHERAVRREVVEFFAIRTPHGMNAPRRGNR